MKLRLAWFGKPAADPFRTQVADYRRRVSRRWPAEDLPLRPAAGGRDADPRRALAAEAEAVRRVMPAGWTTAALDERGDGLSSVAFARWLARLETSGVPGLVLVVGSDLGLDAGLCAAADRRLSLGPLTLPHTIARLVAWEQLFRATHILGGGGYHRHDVQ